MMNPQRLLDRHVRESSEWLKTSAEWLLATSTRSIQQNIDDDSLASFRHISTALSGIGLYFGTRGSLHIRTGIDDGWSDVATAILCYRWGVRVELRAHWAALPAHRFPTFPQRVALPAILLLCFFVSFDDKEHEEWISEWLWQLLVDPTARVADAFERRHFEPLLTWAYYSAYGGKQFPVEISLIDLGSYWRIADYWNDPEVLVAGLEAACDYHCTQMSSRSDYWEAEFHDAPFDMIPFEITCIRRLRDRLGLSTPSFEHPLLMDLPKEPSCKIDGCVEDLIDAIERKYRKFFGSSSK